MSVNELSNQLAEFIVQGLEEKDENKKKVIAYGIFGIIHTFICIILVILLGAICGVTKEALIVAFTIAILRKFSGGAHMGTPYLCAVVGAIIAVGLAFIARESATNPRVVIGIIVISFLFSCYGIYSFAPVDSKAKPIKAEKKILLKKQSMVMLGIYALLVGGLGLMGYIMTSLSLVTYAICICLGISWQSITITPFGGNIITKLDEFLRYYLHKKGEYK